MLSEEGFVPSRPLGEWRRIVERRGRRLIWRNRALRAAPALVLVAGLAAVPLLGRQSPVSQRVHVVGRNPNPAQQAPAPSPSAPTPSRGAGPAGKQTGPVGGGPANAAAPATSSGPAGGPAPSAPGAQFGPGLSSTEDVYTFIRVCSQHTVGPFGGPTAPPYCWQPDKLSIHVGWKVIFDGTQAFGGTVTYHTVTSTSSNWHVDAKVYSDTQFGPGEFSYVFTKTGTYTFYDRNGGGSGTVTVSP